MVLLDYTSSVERIEASGIVAVIRLRDAAGVPALADALVAGGLTALEITMTVPGAAKVIEALVRVLPPHVVVGAGTVLSTETLREVVEAGAEFVVSPVLNPELLESGTSLGVDVIPGCFTPTEIQTAVEMGAEMVKVFPAGILGPSFLKDVLAPMPNLKLMPTGGVTLANAAEWITAGAAAVGIGSALVDPAAIAAGRFEEISARARTLTDSIRAARTAAAPAGPRP